MMRLSKLKSAAGNLSCSGEARWLTSFVVRHCILLIFSVVFLPGFRDLRRGKLVLRDSADGSASFNNKLRLVITPGTCVSYYCL